MWITLFLSLIWFFLLVVTAGVTGWTGDQRAKMDTKMFVKRIAEATEEERRGIFAKHGVDGL